MNIEQSQAAPPKAALQSKVALFIKSNTPLRMLFIGLVSLFLLIPLAMVDSVVSERRSTYDNVLNEVAGVWGAEQVLTGPVLVVPFVEHWLVNETRLRADGSSEVVQIRESRADKAVLLPKSLKLQGTMVPEFRRRGIYQSLVYLAKLNLEGVFSEVEAAIREQGNSTRTMEIDWGKAFVVIGLSDPKGIAEVSVLKINGQTLTLNPGTAITKILPLGFHAMLREKPLPDTSCSLSLELRGSNGFKLSPLGEKTLMQLASEWSHPSFYGDLLPETRTIDKDGFQAAWSIPHLVRSYPQVFTLEQDPHELSGFSMGVRLFEPVTLYTEATRAVKYGFLFIALTFLTLALMELATGIRPSMVQYIVIGVALALFYLLLIALSEHIGFNRAYLIAGLAVVLITTLYCFAVLTRKKLAIIAGVVLSALYAVLYTVLRAEDYALLTGALLLLAALCTTMYFTRHLHRDR